MAPAWLTLRADLRQRWRAMLGLVLLIGVVSGAVLTAAAGARRTDTAYPRMLRWANASQVFVVPGEQGLATGGSGRTGFYPAVRRLPQVAAMSSTILLGMAVVTGHGPPDPNVNTAASLDGAAGRTVDRVRVLAGRWAWAVFAGSAGVASQADVPAGLVLLAIPATLLLANLIATGPGWTAARVPAAAVLRSE